MSQRGWFVVSVSDARLAKEVVRVVRRYSVVRIRAVDDVAQALRGEPGQVAGAVVGGDGLDQLDIVRAQAPRLPVLALLKTPEPGLVNRIQAQGMEVSCLPLHLPSLVAFTQRALSASFLPHDSVAREVAQLAQRQKLTTREVQILIYALGDDPRARVRQRLGIEENTLKTQIRSLLRKCNERNLDALAKNVLRSALLSPRPCEVQSAAALGPVLAHSA